MNAILAEQNSYMEQIKREYGSIVKSAVYKASCVQPWYGS